MTIKMTGFYIDIHILQTVPPCCLNRDDTNSPKICVYGGTVRARVSSQSWKNAMRKLFRELFSDEQVGIRTKKFVGLIAEAVMHKEPEADREAVEAGIIEMLNMKGVELGIKSIEKGNDAMFFLSKKQADAVADVYLEAEELYKKAQEEAEGDKKKKGKKKKDETAKYDAKKVNAALEGHPSLDMALFGRMVAKNAALNCEAAAQVAHAISTHKVSTEYDYFTAVDECSKDTAGAGHLGTVEFNSSTLYRYASLNVRELMESLGEDFSADMAAKFVKAFILSMPTGKQATFANRTVPDMVYVCIRKDQPVNMSGAFERAVIGSKNGYLEESEKRLNDYAKKTYSDFVDAPVKEFVIGMDSFGEDAVKTNLKGLMDALETEVDAVRK